MTQSTVISNTTLAHFNGHNLTMGSRELAALTQTRHDSVKRTIETLSRKQVMGLPQIVETSFTDTLGKAQTVSEYQLHYRDTMVVAARLNPQFMARVVDRWMELEQKQSVQQPTSTELAQMGAQVTQLQAKVSQLQAAALLANPRWAAVARYRAMGLTRNEIGRLLGASLKSVEGLITTIHKAGLTLAAPANPAPGTKRAPAPVVASTQAALWTEAA